MTQARDNVQRLLSIGNLAKLLPMIAAIAAVIFWVQTQGDGKYYTKASGENLEARMVSMEQRLLNIESGNGEILRIVGRLEGSIKNEP